MTRPIHLPHNDSILPPELLRLVGDLASRASGVLVSYFGSSRESLGVETKEDESPVSKADKESDALIVEGLARLLPGIPIVSEESSLPSFAERSGWERFLLVDPLDGTKEFLRGSADFTVNVALVEKGIPVWGVIHVPMEQRLVVGWKGKGAWVAHSRPCIPAESPGASGEEGNTLPWARLPVLSAGAKQQDHGSRGGSGAGLRAVLSQSHRSSSEQPVIDALGLSSLVRRGSSLKFLLVAMGEADVYFRRTPTWEWDTAAGQAIVESVGGVVCDADGANLSYNKTDPRNGAFLACPNSLKETCLERFHRNAPPS